MPAAHQICLPHRFGGDVALAEMATKMRPAALQGS